MLSPGTNDSLADQRPPRLAAKSGGAAASAKHGWHRYLRRKFDGADTAGGEPTKGGVDPLGARADARMSSPWRNTVEALTDRFAGGGSPRSEEAPVGEPLRRIGEEMPAADSKIADQTSRPAIIGHLNVQIVGAGRERDGWQAVRNPPIVALSDQPARIRTALLR